MNAVSLFELGRLSCAALLMGLCLALSGLAQTNTPPKEGFVQIAPFAARLFYEEAQALFKANKPAEGCAKLREALKEFPNYFNALFLLAAESHKLKDDQTALEMLERARRV